MPECVLPECDRAAVRYLVNADASVRDEVRLAAYRISACGPAHAVEAARRLWRRTHGRGDLEVSIVGVREE